MKKQIERRYLAQEVRVAGDKPRITGYAAVFNSMSEDLGFFREEIDSHAFDAVLATNPDVRALFNHDTNFVLGRTTAGTLRLYVDARGLAYEIDPPDTQAARDLMVSMKRGDISQSSYGFVVKRDQWTDNPDGTITRRILEIAELFDVSPVTYPAYTSTSVMARSLPASMPTELRARVLEHRDAADGDDVDCEGLCDECRAGNHGNCTNPECRCEMGMRSRAQRDYTGDAQKVDGVDLTKDCFAYTPDDVPSHWKLPIHFPGNEEKTKSHIHNAIARFDQTDLPADAKEGVWRKIVAAAKAHGIDVSEEDDRAFRQRMNLRLWLASRK